MNQGTYYNGSDFAYMNATNSYVRAPVYGTDALFAAADTTGTALTSGSHNLVSTTSIVGQSSVSVNTIKFDTSLGAVNIGNTGTITLSNGGLLATGGGAASISGGTLALGAELVMRTAAANDSLAISSVISGANAVTKAGPGSATLSGANTFTGAVTVTAARSRSPAATLYRSHNGRHRGTLHQRHDQFGHHRWHYSQ